MPAFTGLGSPWWDPYARGTIVGITRGTTRAHLARAVVESMAFQTRDAVEAMVRASGRALTELRVDGGASVMDGLLQFQADQLGVPVQRPTERETTAIGAAYLAALAEGVRPTSTPWRRSGSWTRRSSRPPTARPPTPPTPRGCAPSTARGPGRMTQAARRSGGGGERGVVGRRRRLRHLAPAPAGEGAHDEVLDGGQQDDQIERQRPVLDVVQVEAVVGVERRVVPGLDLPQAGDAGAHVVAGVEVGRELGDLLRSAGRGPIRLMSPLRTLISCGSSSRLVRRRTWPILVIRGSRAILNSGPVRWLSPSMAASRASASTTIVRNLSIPNSAPSRPTRCWRNSTGPPSSRLTRMAMTASTGEATSRSAPATTMSNSRLTARAGFDGRGRVDVEDGLVGEGRDRDAGGGDAREAGVDDDLGAALLLRPISVARSATTAPEQTAMRATGGGREGRSGRRSRRARGARPGGLGLDAGADDADDWTPASGWISARRTISAARRSVPTTSVRWT